jgi:RhtB (resistance to homoserine/threonine) family protein
LRLDFDIAAAWATTFLSFNQPPMTLSIWLLYVAAVIVLTVTPGPSVLMCISTSVQHGPRHALVASLGSTLAIACIMVLSMLGLGTVLAASETLFSILKWLGAAYLAYLGVTSLLSKASHIAVPEESQPQVSARTLFGRGILVGASNPKALLFFGALFPQFIEPAAPQATQFLVLGLTFIFFELFWLSIYALTAAKARHWLQQPRRATLFNRVTGAVFLLAAGLLATTKRNAA